MDGYQSAQRTRALLGQHVPIYGVSASTDAETNRRCLDSGMDGFAPKPISLQRGCASCLRQRHRALRRRRNSWRQLHKPDVPKSDLRPFAL